MSIVSGRKCDRDQCGKMIQVARGDYWKVEKNSNGCRHPSIVWDFCSLDCLGTWAATSIEAEKVGRKCCEGSN